MSEATSFSPDVIVSGAEADLPEDILNRQSGAWEAVADTDSDSSLVSSAAEEEGGLERVVARLGRIGRSVGHVVSVAVLSAEMLGNEVISVGSTVAAEAATHSTPFALATFAAARFGLEAAGAVAAGDITQTKTGKRLVDKTDAGVQRAGKWFNRLFKDTHLEPIVVGKPTNPVTDGAIALAAGTGVAALNKHRTEPDRPLIKDAKFGLLYGATNTLLTLPTVGLAAVEGISHPQEALKVGAAAIAVAGITAAAKNVLNGRRKVRNYLNVVEQATPGQQLEGLQPEEAQKALKDPRTQYADFINPESGKKITVPFAVPLEYASWINPKFIGEHGYDTERTLYCAIPQSSLAKFDKAEMAQALLNMSSNGYKDLVIDHRADVEPVLATALDHETLNDLATSQADQSITYHYGAVCRGDIAAAEQYQDDPHIHALQPEEIDKYFERIWDIYQSQFQILVDDHPIKYMLARDMLYRQLKDDQTWTSAYVDDKGELQSFGYLVTNIDVCPWLNKKYLEQEAGDKMLGYMPGVATAKRGPGPVSTLVMRNLIKQGVLQSGGDFYLTFECPNYSNRYIPMLTKRAFDQSGMAQIETLRQNQYLYQVLTVE